MGQVLLSWVQARDTVLKAEMSEVEACMPSSCTHSLSLQPASVITHLVHIILTPVEIPWPWQAVHCLTWLCWVSAQDSALKEELAEVEACMH